jgi:putative addiction module CopG family antidote
MLQLPPDIEHQIRHYVSSGAYQTEEDVLRDALRALRDEQSALDDIRKGLEDLDAGRGRALERIDADLREKYDIPQDA